jgi:hypothetical protein
MGGRRLRSCSGWLRNGRFFSANCPARFAGGDQGREEHRSCDYGASAEAIRFTTLGQLATIGRRTGVAMVFGFKFSGFIAWAMWRSIYLAKLPGLAKKLRVMMDWTLDLLFGREIEQMITLHDVQALSDRLARNRAQTKRGSKEQTSLATNIRSS